METKRLRGVHVSKGGETRGKVDDRGERNKERRLEINFFLLPFLPLILGVAPTF